MNPNCKHVKAAQKLLYEKAALKILVKLTPDKPMPVTQQLQWPSENTALQHPDL
jgi:hypothetical protein